MVADGGAGNTVMARGCNHCHCCYYGAHELIHPLSVLATTMNAQSTDFFLTFDGSESSGRDSTASIGASAATRGDGPGPVLIFQGPVAKLQPGASTI